MRERCKFSGDGNAAEQFAKGMRAADVDESDWTLRDELKIIEGNRVFVIMDDHGEERPDLAAVEADTLEDALPVLRMLMQKQDDTFNYVVIDDKIAQFEGREGFLGDAEEITEEELNRPELWDIDCASIWDACELDGSGDPTGVYKQLKKEYGRV